MEELGWARPPLVMRSTAGSSFRVLPDGYALSLGQSTGVAGVRLGPVELVGGVGLSLLNVSSARQQLGFGMLWPRSLAAVCVSLGALRLDLVAHVEYGWDWVGTDRYLRGLGLVISLPRAPIQPPFR